MNINHLVMPDSIDEAYELLQKSRNNVILGGCCFLRMGNKRINNGIDLSKLNLNYIKEENDYVEIGAYTSFREIETSKTLSDCFGESLKDAVGHIVGVQFRNMVTIGATVYSRYGFSDVLTALLAYDVKVELYKGGQVKLEDFLANGCDRDILTKIIISKDQRKTAFDCLRISTSDYAVLNVSASRLDNTYKIIVGARPSRAIQAIKASEYISNKAVQGDIDDEIVKECADIVVQELNFGTNMRGSSKYRKALCRALVKRVVMEVCHEG